VAKRYLTQTVYEATLERLAKVFGEYDHVVVSFSGGKDSGVMLNMALEYASAHGCLDRMSVLHVDYEAQYQMTTDYVTETFCNLPDEVACYWLCLPLKAQCATSATTDHWRPWEASKRALWVREMPEHRGVINEENAEFAYDDWDYATQDNCSDYIADRSGKTCVLVGIRTDESMDRYYAAVSRANPHRHADASYIIDRVGHRFSVAYPVYDWSVEDVWTAHAHFGWQYNRLYDLFHQAGMSVHQMRVASPFNNCAQADLQMYRVIDPSNWARMVGRVNGVNFTSIYGGTTAMGWKSITKPSHLSWREYAEFLLSTLPEGTRANYLDKLETSIRFWREQGGAMEDETIGEIVAGGTQIIEGTTNRKTDKRVVRFEEYPDETAAVDFRAVPSYKRLCVCIMKNDLTCKYMGFTRTQREDRLRREAIEKWQSIL